MVFLGLAVKGGKPIKGKNIGKMCVFYLLHRRRGKEWRREKQARCGGRKERETTQRERDTSGGTTWDTHGHTHASGKNTYTQLKKCSRYTPDSDTHIYTHSDHS